MKKPPVAAFGGADGNPPEKSASQEGCPVPRQAFHQPASGWRIKRDAALRNAQHGLRYGGRGAWKGIFDCNNPIRTRPGKEFSKPCETDKFRFAFPLE